MAGKAFAASGELSRQWYHQVRGRGNAATGQEPGFPQALRHLMGSTYAAMIFFERKRLTPGPQLSITALHERGA